MNRFDRLEARLESLQQQMASDFDASMAGFSAQRDAIQAGLDAQGAILKEHAQRTDQRFTQVIEVVREYRNILTDHERRLRRLESRRPPAA